MVTSPAAGSASPGRPPRRRRVRCACALQNICLGFFPPDKLLLRLNAVAVASHCPHQHNTTPTQQMSQQHTANICYHLRRCDVFRFVAMRRRDKSHPFFPRSVFFFYRTRCCFIQFPHLMMSPSHPNRMHNFSSHAPKDGSCSPRTEVFFWLTVHASRNEISICDIWGSATIQACLNYVAGRVTVSACRPSPPRTNNQPGGGGGISEPTLGERVEETDGIPVDLDGSVDNTF